MMKRSPMKRTSFVTKPKRRRSKAQREAREGKPDTRPKVSKGPARDARHLAKVREFGCVICRKGAEAHHVRCIGPRTMGVRVSDHLTIGLCKPHHEKLHMMRESDFWLVCNIHPAVWISAFSPEGAAEIAKIRGIRKEQP